MGEAASVVVVTGAFGALGRTVASTFAARGARLALLDLAPAKAQARVQVFGEAKREAEAEPEVQTAVVRLSFKKPPEPQAEQPSKGK